jgi:hypothetical protein
MNSDRMLLIASLLSILFMTFHGTQDTLRARVGTAEAAGSTFLAVPVLVVWLYGTLVLTGRRSGYIIVIVESLFALSMPAIHMGPGLARTDVAGGAFLFVWTLMALGVTAMFSVILAARGLRNLQPGQTR